jgi:hypothetical protein
MAVLLKLPPDTTEQPSMPPAAGYAAASYTKQHPATQAAVIGAAAASAGFTTPRGQHDQQHIQQQRQHQPQQPQPQQQKQPAAKQPGASSCKHPSITPETLQYALPQHYFASPQQQLLATAAQELHELRMGRGLRCPASDKQHSTASGEHRVTLHIIVVSKYQVSVAAVLLPVTALHAAVCAGVHIALSCKHALLTLYFKSSNNCFLPLSFQCLYVAGLATSMSKPSVGFLAKCRKGLAAVAAAFSRNAAPAVNDSMRDTPCSTAMFAAPANPQQQASSVASLQRRLRQEVWSLSLPSDQYLLCRSPDGIDSPVRFSPVRFSASEGACSGQAQKPGQRRVQQELLRAHRAASVQHELQETRAVLRRAAAALRLERSKLSCASQLCR